MILFTYISVGLKYLYDKIVDESGLSDASKQDFIDFSQIYLLYDSLMVFDAIIIFLMSISVIKYTFFWIPSLGLITTAL